MIVFYLNYIQQIKANPMEAYKMLSATDADKCINKSWSSLEFLNHYLVARHAVYYNFLFLFSIFIYSVCINLCIRH